MDEPVAITGRNTGGSRSAISNLCFASALITYGNGHPVDPCTHTHVHTLLVFTRARVHRWFAGVIYVLERDDTSANDIDDATGYTHFFPRIMEEGGGGKKEERMDFTIVSRILRIFAFRNFNISEHVLFGFFGVQGSIDSGRRSLHRTGRN